MKIRHSTIGILTLASAILVAAPPAVAGVEIQLRPGIVVDFNDKGLSNQVWVKLGDTVVAIDPTSATTPSRGGPGFVVATGAGTIFPEASPVAILQPASRSRSGAATGGPAVIVEDGFTLTSIDREIVLFDLGRRATASDVVVWLPRERMLVTGRLCSQTGVAVSDESDTKSWIDALDRLLDLDPELVIPFTGKPGGRELIDAQRKRLEDLRGSATEALLDGRNADDALGSFGEDWFEVWQHAEPEEAAAAYGAVYTEIAGLRPPRELIEDRRLRPGASPTRDEPGWTRPRKVLWRNYWPDRLPMLAQVAPDVEIVPFENTEEALAGVGDADAIIGTASRELLAAGSKLRWVQVGSAGVERYLQIPELGSGKVLLTNGQRLASEIIGEHVMALTRALARGLNRAVAAQIEGEWERSEIGNEAPLTGLRGKTMLVVGLGGIGTEVARLADGAGMRVLAIRNSRRSGPAFVDRVGLNEDLVAFLGEADVVANCLPLTDDTRGTFDAELFAAMKPTAFFVNVGRGGTVTTADLITALEDGIIAGAGLDVTDPEPLPEGHPLWKAPNLIITPHFAAWSDGDRELRWLLYRENLRRFVAGEQLLSVVDPDRGY